MKLVNLTLINIGPYVGVNTFELNSDKEINTSLIGGRNGTGKTTFLESIKLGLYGPLALGFKTTSATYLKEIDSLLNDDEKEKNLPEFQISIDVMLTENWQEKQYSIKRSWDILNNNLTEKVEITSGAKILSPIDKDNFFNKLFNRFPPDLFDLCLFDGEKIKSLDDSNLANYLRELSLNLFNLDLFNELKRELVRYVRQTADTERETKLITEIDDISNEIESISKEINLIKTKITNKLQENDELNAINKKITKEFRMHGGLMRDERDRIQNEINELELDRKMSFEKIKEFTAERLPFYLAQKMLNELNDQLKSEENYYLSSALREKVNKLPISEILQSSNITDDQVLVKQLRKDLLAHLIDDININLIHNISKTESQTIFNLKDDISKDNLQKTIKMVRKNRQQLTRLRNLRNQLRINQENSEFSELLSELKRNNQIINENESAVAVLQIELGKKAAVLVEHETKYERMRKTLSRLQRKRKSFAEADKAMRTTKRFIDLQMSRKIKDIEYFALSMIKKVMRKTDFISKLSIDPNTFEISIFDNNQRIINTRTLSAGESQMLILCIIWGTLAASKKKVPFVFDTLFGRLDQPHRIAIIEKLIPMFGEQVIVLATDTEITSDLYVKLKPSIANEYVLEYIDESRKTKIHDGIFFTSKEVMPF